MYLTYVNAYKDVVQCFAKDLCDSVTKMLSFESFA